MLPFDIDGEEPLHVGGAAAHCGSEGLSLAVAEEKHLEHMGVIDRHTAAGHLPVAILESHRKKFILLPAVQQFSGYNSMAQVYVLLTFRSSWVISSTFVT